MSRKILNHIRDISLSMENAGWIGPRPFEATYTSSSGIFLNKRSDGYVEHIHYLTLRVRLGHHQIPYDTSTDNEHSHNAARQWVSNLNRHQGIEWSIKRIFRGTDSIQQYEFIKYLEMNLRIYPQHDRRYLAELIIGHVPSIDDLIFHLRDIP